MPDTYTQASVPKTNVLYFEGEVPKLVFPTPLTYTLVESPNDSGDKSQVSQVFPL